MAKALVITTEGELYSQDIPDENGHRLLNEICGGWIDAVRTDEVVGYVHDEGLLIGLAPNLVASALFGRPLVGNCVVLGVLNERGEYDGENYDAPAPLFSDAFREMAEVIATDEDFGVAVRTLITNINLTPTITPLTDEQFEAWLNGEGE